MKSQLRFLLNRQNLIAKSSYINQLTLPESDNLLKKKLSWKIPNLVEKNVRNMIRT